MFGIGCKMRHIGCNYTEEGCHNGIGYNWGCRYGLTWQEGCELASKDDYFRKIDAVCRICGKQMTMDADPDILSYVKENNIIPPLSVECRECRETASSGKVQDRAHHEMRPQGNKRPLRKILYVIGIIVAGAVLSSTDLPRRATSSFINVIGDIMLNWIIYAVVMSFAVLLLLPAIIQSAFNRKPCKGKTRNRQAPQ